MNSLLEFINHVHTWNLYHYKMPVGGQSFCMKCKYYASWNGTCLPKRENFRFCCFRNNYSKFEYYNGCNSTYQVSYADVLNFGLEI